MIPKGLVHLQKLFHENDVAKKPRVSPNESEVDEFNVGIDKDLKLSSCLIPCPLKTERNILN